MIKAMPLKVVVLPDEKVTETESGLYIGKMNLEGALRRGKVLSVGRDVTDLKEGDRIAYMAFTGLPIHYEGTRYLTMFESEVVGKEQKYDSRVN